MGIMKRFRSIAAVLAAALLALTGCSTSDSTPKPQATPIIIQSESDNATSEQSEPESQPIRYVEIEINREPVGTASVQLTEDLFRSFSDCRGDWAVERKYYNTEFQPCGQVIGDKYLEYAVIVKNPPRHAHAWAWPSARVEARDHFALQKFGLGYCEIPSGKGLYACKFRVNLDRIDTESLRAVFKNELQRGLGKMVSDADLRNRYFVNAAITPYRGENPKNPPQYDLPEYTGISAEVRTLRE